MKLTFDQETHTYWYGNKKVPSVTSIIKPLIDFQNIPENILNRASSFGTAVHFACELFDKNDLDEDSLNERIVPRLDAWKNFISDYKVKWEKIEEKVFHENLFYAGTLDRVGEVNGIKCIVDIKTSLKVHPAAGVQLCAYQNALKDGFSTIKKRLVVQLKKYGEYTITEFKDPLDLSVFLSLLTMKNWCESRNIVPKF